MFKVLIKYIHRAREACVARGICYCGYALAKRSQFHMRVYMMQCLNKIRKYGYKRLLSRRFKFQGKKYYYFCHKYNCTWTNERAVEIPIIWKIMKENTGKRIL